MADDETQGPEVASWWASDAFDDSSLPTTTFDEPLVWPESPDWDDTEGAEAPDGRFDALRHETGHEADLLFPPQGPESDAQWRPAQEPADPDATVAHLGPLAGLGGGAAPVRTTPEVRDDLPWPAPTGSSRSTGPHTGETARPSELGSIWSNDFRSDPENLAGFSDLPAPAIYAETERNGRGPRWRGFDIRPGNAAVIGLISVVSLVLLGMFLSVRARNDTPTDTSQARPPGDEIAVTGPLNTVPVTTTVTSTTLLPGINIAELVPPTETTGDVGTTGAGTGSGAGTGTAATPAPARATAPTGGGGSGGSTTPSATQPPATQPPATSPPATSPPATSPPATSPPETSPPVTSPPVTSPPVDTPPTTRPTTPTPTFTIPVAPTYTIPTFPGVPDRDR